MGLWWLVGRSAFAIYKRYVLLLAYLVVLLLTAGGAQQPAVVILQFGSLLAVVVFFIACMEGHLDVQGINLKAIQITSIALILICLGSLVLYEISPMSTFDLESESSDGVRRFRGLLGEPGELGSIAGVLLGLSLFASGGLLRRLIGVAVSVPCLYMTGSRTFWAAAVVAMTCTAIFYIRRKAVAVAIGLVSLTVVALLFMVGNVQVSSDTEARILRKDSLSNMSGRTKIWEAAYIRFFDRPILGYGFTQGHTAFEKSTTNELQVLQNDDSSSHGERKYDPTLHSGYIQALVDSGAMGAVLYMSIILFSIWYVLRYDTDRIFGTVLYSLVFISIANGGESIIFAASGFSSVFYWYNAVLAFSLRRAAEPLRIEALPPSYEPQPPPGRYPLLSTPRQPTPRVQ